MQQYTYSLLTPWCRVLPEQLPGLQLAKKFPAFHGTRRFITALTSVRNIMQIFIYCKVTLHVSGVTAPIIRSTKNCNRSLWYRS